MYLSVYACIYHFLVKALSKGEKKADIRFPAVKVTTPPKGPAVEVLSGEDEVVPTFQDSFVDALAQATENMQIANQGIHCF